MPGFVIRNEIMRDELLKFAYPFDENSVLENNEVYIGTDLFLDTVLFFKDPAVELPVFISTIDGTVNNRPDFSVILSDNRNQIVGRGVVIPNQEVIEVVNDEGVLVGMFVMNVPAVHRFAGSVTGMLFDLLPDVATFMLDVCHVSRTSYLRYIKADSQALTGVVNVVARHGCKFSDNDGTVSLDVVSENPAGADGVRSVNDVVNRSIWLANHPELNMRIDSRDGTIKFTHVKDETV